MKRWVVTIEATLEIEGDYPSTEAVMRLVAETTELPGEVRGMRVDVSVPPALRTFLNGIADNNERRDGTE